jgi:hypothetical protein
MSDRKWQDHVLSDIIETQLLLFFHLSGVLHQAGILPREVSAEALRETAKQDELRPGVRSCLRAVAELLEQAEDKPAARPWEPRVVPGGGPETDKGARTETGAKPRARSDKTGNGRAGNGNLPPGWRPRFVGDPDPDSDPDCA